MPTRDAQLNIRVTEARKDDWTEFVENTRAVDGVSDLVRKAVTAYIEAGGSPAAIGGSSGDGQSNTLPDNLSERLAVIEDEVSDVSTTVDRIDESTGYIERKLTEDDDNGLSDRLMRSIPPAKPLTDRWESLRDEFKSRPLDDPYIWQGTVSAFADELADGESHPDELLVEQSLDALLKGNDVPIETTETDGERRYWVERNPERQPFADGRTLEDSVEDRQYRRRQEER